MLGPFEPVSCWDLPHSLQIALVAGDDADGHHPAPFQPGLALDLDHLVEVFQGLQRICLRDIVHQEERVRGQVGGAPQAPILLLAGGIGEVEGVGDAIDGSRDGIRVFDCGIVSIGASMRPRRGEAPKAHGTYS